MALHAACAPLKFFLIRAVLVALVASSLESSWAIPDFAEIPQAERARHIVVLVTFGAGPEGATIFTASIVGLTSVPVSKEWGNS